MISSNTASTATVTATTPVTPDVPDVAVIVAVPGLSALTSAPAETGDTVATGVSDEVHVMEPASVGYIATSTAKPNGSRAKTWTWNCAPTLAVTAAGTTNSSAISDGFSRVLTRGRTSAASGGHAAADTANSSRVHTLFRRRTRIFEPRRLG